nr:DUF423 domain-containing protein [Psychromonas antarctica]
MTLSCRARLFLIIASLFGAIGVAAGAYASHGLSRWASSAQIEYFQLAVTYQLFHAITLSVVCVLSVFINNRCLLLSQIGFVLGVFLFSGSLYLYVLTGIKAVAVFTPIGGLLLIIAWLSMLLALLKNKN